MKNKSLKTSLLASALSLAACGAMFVGSTFAWFTDKATTTVNTIQSGILDVKLVDVNGASLENTPLSFDGDALWVPGSTHALPAIYVENAGDIALKYKLFLTGIGGDAKLNEVIDWTMKVGEETLDLGEVGHLAAGEVSAPIVITGEWTTHMNDNDYMGLKIENITLSVSATQDVEAATITEVSSESGLTAALANAHAGDTITLTTTTPITTTMNVPEGVIIDGLGTAEVKGDVNVPHGGTIRNVKFTKVARVNQSSLYAKNLDKDILIENCTFEDSDWDALQITPTAEIKIIIRNNTFKAADSGRTYRHIHIQQMGDHRGTNLDIQIYGNKFLNNDKFKTVAYDDGRNETGPAIDLDYIGSKANILIGNNIFDGDINETNLSTRGMYICLGRAIDNVATMADFAQAQAATVARLG